MYLQRTNSVPKVRRQVCTHLRSCEPWMRNVGQREKYGAPLFHLLACGLLLLTCAPFIVRMITYLYGDSYLFFFVTDERSLLVLYLEKPLHDCDLSKRHWHR